jgi:hypothetical protein
MVERQFDAAPDVSAEGQTDSTPSDVQPSRSEQPVEEQPTPQSGPLDSAPPPASEPDYQPTPDLFYSPQQPPWQQQAAPSPGLMPGDVGAQLDWNLLNPAYVTARAQAIQARYDAPYRAAATENERTIIRERYEAEGRRLELEIERTKFSAERWQHEEEKRRMMASQISEMRVKAAETLARDYKLSTNEVLRDEDGREITDPHEMQRHARLMARIKYGERVTERTASGVDRGYQPSGGSGPSTEEERWSRMSDAEFQQAWSRQRTGGSRSQV